MELSRAVVYRTELKEFTPILSQNIFAEVVLIDRSHHPLQPVLYQLLKNFDEIKNTNILALDTEAFTPLGLILSIDRAKKQIILSTDYMVTYQYLIIATGPHYTATHNAAGFKTLLEALRMRKKIPYPMAAKNENSSSFQQMHIFSQNPHAPQKLIETIVSTHLPTDDPSASNDLSNQHKNLFEVQM